MKKIIVIVGLVLITAGVGWWLVEGVIRGELINPMGRKTGIIKRETDLEVIGFLPTWMIGKTEVYCEELTEMVFLGVEVEADGSLVWETQSKKIDGAEYKALKEKFKHCGGKNILGIKLFEDKKLEKLLSNSEARARLITETRAEIGGFEGVNVDFEYMSDPNKVLGEEFISLIRELKMAGLGEISVDVFASTVIKGPEVGLRSLVETADRLVVMGYDFHRSGSQYAGPVAPIGSAPGERNINEVMRRIVDLGLNRKKIIVAYPLYGYEWITVDESLGSRVEEYVGMWSLRRVESEKSKIKSYKNFKENWDEASMTPWMSWEETVRKPKLESYKVGNRWKSKTVYYDDKEVHQVYFENERSLKIKIDMVKQAGLVGTGFWALGYEPGRYWKDIF